MGEVLERLRARLSDRYAIEAQVGAGHLATIYRARDLNRPRHVAVKVLRPHVAAILGPRRFQRHTAAVAQLSHSGMLPLFEAGGADGLLWTVMPYVPRGPMNPAGLATGTVAALRLAGEAADALHHAHEHGIVHGAIKPSNILLEDGHAILTDFVITQAIQKRLTRSPLGEVTAPIIEVSPYASPEQQNGIVFLDGRTDIYSLASVLCEVLLGVAPARSTVERPGAPQQISARIPETHRAALFALPESVQQMLEVALAVHPEDRFKTAGAFAAALTSVGNEVATNHEIDRIVTNTGPRPRVENPNHSGDYQPVRG